MLALLIWTGVTLAQNQSWLAIDPSQEWVQINMDGFGSAETNGVNSLEIFDGQLYAGASSWVNGCQVWRMDAEGWTPVTELGYTSTLTNTNLGVPDLFVFDNHLYAGTGWGTQGQIWRSPDGNTWEPVVENGFGNPENTGISAFTIYSDTLYASTMNNNQGLEIWSIPTGDELSWTPVITAGFGYTSNINVTDFIQFEDFLYAATEPKFGSGNTCQVWRSPNGIAWEPFTTTCFGDVNNQSAGGFAIFHDDLYLGVRNDVTGGQIWISGDGVQWDQLVGNGFGDINNVKIESLVVYKGQLFAATQNNVTGMEVWRTADGLEWHQANLDGFGDAGNFATLWNHGTIIYEGHLIYSTWNGVTGGEIWRYDPEEVKLFLPIVKK